MLIDTGRAKVKAHSRSSYRAHHKFQENHKKGPYAVISTSG